MTETIVNRTAETAGQQIEKLRLEAETPETTAEIVQAFTPIGDPLAKLATVEASPTGFRSSVGASSVLNTAESARAEQVGKIEFEPQVQTEALEAQTRELLHSLIAGRAAHEVVSIPEQKSEFSEFRDKVISAFRHLGLDVRKHFGV